MKLNDDWDQVYRGATLSLQNRIEVLELENTAIKQLNSRLLLKVEHQQVNTVKLQAGILVRATLQAGTVEHTETSLNLCKPCKVACHVSRWWQVTEVVYMCETYCYFGVAECEGVLWAGTNAGAEEKPGTARIH